MKNSREKPKFSAEEQKTNFQLMAMKFQLELGENGEDIVRMVTQYIEQGWMEWDQATMMLKDILKPEQDD